MEIETYKTLVLEIYDTVSEPSSWPTVLDRICETVSARGTIIFEWQATGAGRQLITPYHTTGYDPEILASYLKRNHIYEVQDQDLYERQLLSVDGIEVISEDFLYEREEDYLARPHVRELGEYGIRYRTGSLLDKDNPFRSRFSLQLSDARGPLEGDDLETIKSLLLHVAKALDVGRPMAAQGIEKRALGAILDRLNVGICLLDKGGRVMLTNAEFERQRQDYGTYPIDASGILRLDPRADVTRFSRMLSSVTSHGHFGARPRKEAIVVASDDESRTLCMEVVPLGKSEMLGSTPIDGAMLISRDTSLPQEIDLDLVRQVYVDLTKTELAVIELICEGLTNAEIAERRGRSVDTINHQVKSILGKARANNRTQLVRLLGNFTMPDMFASA